jgi:hypothetical protein
MRSYWVYFLFFVAAATLLGVVYIWVNKTNPPTDIADSPILPTWDPSELDAFPQATVGNGTLSISGSCVLFIQNQKTILLVWPEPTHWNESSLVIEFVDPDGGRRIELRNGDQVMPGGSGVSREAKFVSPPDPSCKADEIFIVNSLRLVTD